MIVHARLKLVSQEMSPAKPLPAGISDAGSEQRVFELGNFHPLSEFGE
jgi:hypothetical protein